METYFDCIPCFVRQTLDTVRMVTNDKSVQEKMLRKVLQDISTMDLQQSPPVMAQHIHRFIREVSGQSDPYLSIKNRFNQVALEIYPELKNQVENSANPLETALRLAIAGNVIDSGVNSNLQENHVHEAIEHALTAPFGGDVEGFSKAVAAADKILYLADNAGEIVFDRLLLGQLPLTKVTLAVKGAPIINDATLADAQAAGITKLVQVIDNGSDAPGTVLTDCSETFRKYFAQADLVIAKGQGNYETLSQEKKDIFFVLKAKCPVIAQDLGCQVGSLVLRQTQFATSA
jgi:uncharacterized protein with ATP-grasp and redox domains